MNWSVADARARLSELLRAVEAEPQSVSSRGRRIAVILRPEEFDAYDAWRRTHSTGTLAQALDDVQRACADEGYELEVPGRRDRPNAFTVGR